MTGWLTVFQDSSCISVIKYAVFFSLDCPRDNFGCLKLLPGRCKTMGNWIRRCCFLSAFCCYPTITGMIYSSPIKMFSLQSLFKKRKKKSQFGIKHLMEKQHERGDIQKNEISRRRLCGRNATRRWVQGWRMRSITYLQGGCQVSVYYY